MDHDPADTPLPPEPDDAGVVELYWAKPPVPLEPPSYSELWLDLGGGD